MIHKTTSGFWKRYHSLPGKTRDLADKNFAILKENPNHPSIHFKSVGATLKSARIGRDYRAIAVERDYGYLWIWIGSHAEYDKMLSQ